MTRKLIHPVVVTAAAVTVTAMMTTAAAGTTPRASQAAHDHDADQARRRDHW